ncbi:hypothetical protein KIL84_019714 [Mauremys mutica]|uniref:Uncharacterized protein n=1 Tax=Mauremys mutica TaxID=74926 RepID=A0A9D3XXA7_9SAUR|nr:hypothetical protein KIL84_019714 [Mauremys mutica]
MYIKSPMTDKLAAHMELPHYYQPLNKIWSVQNPGTHGVQRAFASPKDAFKCCIEFSPTPPCARSCKHFRAMPLLSGCEKEGSVCIATTHWVWISKLSLSSHTQAAQLSCSCPREWERGAGKQT